MAKTQQSEQPDVEPAHPVLGSVWHDGILYAPDTDSDAIPSAALSEPQLAALIEAGVVAVAAASMPSEGPSGGP